MGYKFLIGNIAQILGQYGAWHIAGDSGMTSSLSNPLSSSWTNMESSLWVQCSFSFIDGWVNITEPGRTGILRWNVGQLLRVSSVPKVFQDLFPLQYW